MQKKNKTRIFCLFLFSNQLESQCRPNLCKSSERCVLSLQSRPTCIRCHPYSSRFYGLSGECSTKIAVCGDDQYLYKNYCVLLREQCERSRFINIIDYDQCPKQLNFMRKRKKEPVYPRQLDILFRMI